LISIRNIKSEDHLGSMITEHLTLKNNRYKCCVAFKMEQKDILGLIPGQFKGQALEVEASRLLDNVTAAKTLYQVAKKKLFSVNDWHEIVDGITARFQIVDQSGNEVSRKVNKGDYLRINIPGPGNKEGDGYDWVVVEEMKEINKEDFQSAGFRVRPTENPFGKKNETAHFYSNETTSTFIVTRENVKVVSWIVDRNMLPNTESASLVDKVRDVMVGVSGIAGFSKVQWQGLADGLLK
jgi:hypothetical protein